MCDGKSGDVVARLEAEDLGIEGELCLERGHDRLRLSEPVPLTLEEQIGMRDSSLLECGDDQLRLGGRHDHVVGSLQDEHGRR